ncbi:hypothetical protein GH714_004413 [Hevea brasiliensis]|uniref:Uncharacterized protein n=1 Tax=Hevea brasiliensis TaxID=3981 RepID=A0A6A6M7L8_HEVBR|nr:hypothetical protein GH714_004413 [Hevea brasiliensis]
MAMETATMRENSNGEESDSNGLKWRKKVTAKVNDNGSEPVVALTWCYNWRAGNHVKGVNLQSNGLNVLRLDRKGWGRRARSAKGGSSRWWRSARWWVNVGDFTENSLTAAGISLASSSTLAGLEAALCD